MELLQGLDKTTLRERAREALRLAITSGQYRPGDHLGEVELAGRLEISRGTVREALRHLQQEGLVTAGRRGMLRVNELSPEEIRGLYRVRAALEGLAVSTIIESPQRDTSVSALCTALDRLADTAVTFAERLEADLKFHLLLCELADNSMLVESWRHLEGRIRVAVMSHPAEQRPAIMSRDRHAPIVDAIAAGDASSALTVVQQHMAVAAELYASSA